MDILFDAHENFQKWFMKNLFGRIFFNIAVHETMYFGEKEKKIANCNELSENEGIPYTYIHSQQNVQINSPSHVSRVVEQNFDIL